VLVGCGCRAAWPHDPALDHEVRTTTSGDDGAGAVVKTTGSLAKAIDGAEGE
jgi:hypothetical protein